MSEPIRARPWYSEISRRGRLRTKFLLSLLVISASLTCSTLLVVRHRVQLQVREQIREALESSVVTFQHFQGQREITLERSAALLASLPTLKALMTSHDPRTIQDGSTEPWQTIGSDLFVLADRGGRLMSLHANTPEFSFIEARDLLQQSLHSDASRDWWFGGGHLFQVFLQPIYSGEPSNGVELGVLVVGYEINRQVAADVRRVASSEVAFRYGPNLVASTLAAQQNEELKAQAWLRPAAAGAPPVDIDLGHERFLATSTDLASPSGLSVSLIVLKSYDQAAAFVQSLNRWLAGLGLAAILAGSLLVYLISDTFTRPLARLVGGVHALEKGDFNYPLEARGNDEVSELTHSFDQMRRTLQNTQQELLNAERLATIGRMASTVSHDLRHSLTAILAYAEFLSERTLPESRRVEYYEEIRQAVNQMTDQLRALLEFSKDKLVYRPVHASVADIIHHSIHTVRARPEFRGIQITTSFENGCEGWFDAGRIERVFQNLLFNACEAVPPEAGRIEVSTRQTAATLEIRVADNGGGIPEEIRATVFQPFVTSGKDNGIGLGLAVVQKIVQEHHGEVAVERTGRDGTVIRITLPAVPSGKKVVSQNPA
ncbi:MAG TPA: ATP-binding protein [Terriglobia bacterium]|nr:ATP-binding protein [Terriglobia bacterium]